MKYTKKISILLSAIVLLIACGLTVFAVEASAAETKTYTVEYYLDGVKQTSLTQTCTYGTTYKYKSVPSKTGYTVNGWYTSSSASGTQYAAGTSFTNLTSTNGGIVKRYAVSTANKLRIYYNANGGLISSTKAETYYLSSNTIYLKSSSSKYHQSWLYNATQSNGLVNDETFGLYKVGYVFKGWTLVKNDSQNIISESQSLKPTDLTSAIKNGTTSVTVYAYWEPITYTVEYYLDGAKYLTQTCKYNTTYEYETPTKTGYSISNWWNDSSFASGTQYTAGSSFINLTSINNSTVKKYAYSTPNKLRIYYDANGGFINSEKSNTYRISSNIIYSISSNTKYHQSWLYDELKPNGLVNDETFGLYRDGYIFKGWTLVKNDTENIISESKSLKPTNLTSEIMNGDTSVTVYAYWVPSITIYYNAYNSWYDIAVGSRDSQTIYYGTPQKLKTHTELGFERESYVFVGWNSKPDGSGIEYNTTEEYTYEQLKDDGIQTLYAQWTKRYTVEYYIDGLLKPELTQYCEFDQSYQFAEYINEKYTISNWYDNPEYTGSSYSPNSTFIKSANENNLVITYYAYSTPKSRIIFWYFPDINEQLFYVCTKYYDINKPIILPDSSSVEFKNSCYHIVGWKTERDGSGITFDTNTKYAYSDFENEPSFKGILYPVWAPNSLTITYFPNGASINSDNSLNTNCHQTFTVRVDWIQPLLSISDVGFVRDGYRFIGWNTKEDGSGTMYYTNTDYFAYKLNKDIETKNCELALYAQWEPLKKIKIIYFANGASFDAQPNDKINRYQTYIENETISLLTDLDVGFVYEGYKFVGWNTKEDGSGTMYNAAEDYTFKILYNDPLMQYENIVLWAQWESIE